MNRSGEAVLGPSGAGSRGNLPPARLGFLGPLPKRRGEEWRRRLRRWRNSCPCQGDGGVECWKMVGRKGRGV